MQIIILILACTLTMACEEKTVEPADPMDQFLRELAQRPPEIARDDAVTGEPTIVLSKTKGLDTRGLRGEPAPWTIEHAGKIAVIDGTVGHAGEMRDGYPDVRIYELGGKDFWVTAQFPKKDAQTLIMLSMNQRVKVVGEINPGWMQLVRCRIVEVGDNPALTISMDEIARELEFNPFRLHRLADEATLIIEGEIASFEEDKQSEGVYRGALKSSIAGLAHHTYEFTVPKYRPEDSKGLKTGMKLWLKTDYPSIDGARLDYGAKRRLHNQTSQMPSVHRAPPEGKFLSYADLARVPHDVINLTFEELAKARAGGDHETWAKPWVGKRVSLKGIPRKFEFDEVNQRSKLWVAPEGADDADKVCICEFGADMKDRLQALPRDQSIAVVGEFELGWPSGFMLFNARIN